MTIPRTPDTKPLRGMALLRALRAGQPTGKPQPLHRVLADNRAAQAEAEGVEQ